MVRYALPQPWLILFCIFAGGYIIIYNTQKSNITHVKQNIEMPYYFPFKLKLSGCIERAAKIYYSNSTKFFQHFSDCIHSYIPIEYSKMEIPYNHILEKYKYVKKFNITYIKNYFLDYSNIPIPFNAPLILEWNAFSKHVGTGKGSTFGKVEDYKKDCPFKCIYTDDHKFEAIADMITFNFGNLTLSNFPKRRNSNSLNVFISFESPQHRSFFRQAPKDYFNLTVTYRLDSDIPLYYDFFEPIEKIEDGWDQNKVNEIINKKSKPILFMVSHCQTPSKRETLVSEIKKYINVTQFGKCNGIFCKANTTCEKENIESHYFTLAFENSDCIDYVTEKTYRLRNLIVPIILDRSILRGIHAKLNPYVIAVNDFGSTRDLVKYLNFLMENKNEYKKYFEWTKLYKKKHKDATIHILDDLACKLCEISWQTKFNGIRRIIPDFHEWWGNNKCRVSFGEIYSKNGNASKIPSLIYAALN